MFTIKLYSEYANGTWGRQRIYSAESFTVLRAPNGTAEITLHQKNQNDDFRVDIEWEHFKDQSGGNPIYYPPVFQRAVIENAAGRTTDIISLGPDPRKGNQQPQGSSLTFTIPAPAPTQSHHVVG